MLDLFFAAAAAVGAPTTPSGMVVSLGSSNARVCYEAAEARSLDRTSMDRCNTALSEALIAHDEVATHVNRGILRFLRGDVAGADQDYSAALALDPAQPEAWLNKGILMVRQGRSADALAPLNRAIELRTRMPALAYYARGIANEDTGNIRAAYNDLRQAQALSPKWKDPAVELARYQVRNR